MKMKSRFMNYGKVDMAALRNVSGDVGGGMGRDYMEKEWGITENKKE